MVESQSRALIIPSFCQRLVLVIRSAAWQLGGGKVQDALAGLIRHEVDKAQEILVGIAKAHAARPIPDSKYDAEREKLKVAISWQTFQVLTIRSV